MNKNYSWDVFWVERGCLSWIRAALPSVRLGVTQPLVMSPRIDSNNAINHFSIDSRISRLNSFQTLVWYCYWMEGDRLDLIRGLVTRYLFSSFFFGIFWYIQRKFSASFLSLLMFSFSAQESSLSVGNNTWSSRHKGDMLMWGGDHHCDYHRHHQNLRNHHKIKRTTCKDLGSGGESFPGLVVGCPRKQDRKENQGANDHEHEHEDDIIIILRRYFWNEKANFRLSSWQLAQWADKGIKEKDSSVNLLLSFGMPHLSSSLLLIFFVRYGPVLGIWVVALNNLRNIKYKKALKASLSMGGLVGPKVLGQNTDDIKLGVLSQGHLCQKSRNTLVKMMAKPFLWN